MKRTKLADNWKVYRDKDAFSLVYTLPADAKDVSIPYDALWYEEQKKDSMSSGRTSFLDGGVFHYYKELQIGEELKGSKLLLYFEGVFSRSYVYLNGSLVGQGYFGYSGFFCDITDYAKFGETNVLLVVSKTTALSSRWYSGAGIVKDVWLLEGREAYIEPKSFYLETLEVSAAGVRAAVHADVKNLNNCAEDLAAVLTVSDKDGFSYERSFRIRVKAGSTGSIDHQTLIIGAQPWDDIDPNCYTCSLKLVRTGSEEVLDEDAYTCGFRVLAWDAANGMTVNGRTVKLRGGCLHHDEGMLGGVSLYDYEYRRIKKMKEAGFNAVRSAHNHAAPQLLAACEALGVYVLDEVCDMWTKMKGYEDYTQYFEGNWKENVRGMVEDDRRCACVVGYSTGNEISDICTDKGIETSHEIYHYFKKLDPSRFITNGINGAFAAGDGLLQIASDLTGKDKSEFADGDVNKFMFLMATQMTNIVRHPVITGILEQLDPSMDVMGYNYMTSRYAPDAEAYPDRLMLGTETYPKQIADNWRNITAIPQCVGDFTWTGWDYTGELGETPDNFPCWNNEAGDIDTTGFRTPVSYYREIVFGLRTKPYICVRPPQSFGAPREFGPWRFTDGQAKWTYSDGEFTENNPEHILTVEVYSPADEVELFLNGKSLGVHQCGDAADFYTLYEVPYEAGTLEAVSLGSEGESFVLETAGAPAALTIEAEEDSPLEGSEGLVFLNIGLADKDGRTVQGSGETLSIECDGAELLGFASLGQDHRCGFTLPEIRFTGTNALAVVRKTADKASAKVSCADGSISAQWRG